MAQAGMLQDGIPLKTGSIAKSGVYSQTQRTEKAIICKKLVWRWEQPFLYPANRSITFGHYNHG